MAKKRDEILNELQVEQIKAIVGQQLISVGSLLRYNGVTEFNDPNDIPSLAKVISLLDSGLSFEEFTDADLEDDGGGTFYLPFELSPEQSILAIRIDLDGGSSLLMSPNYDFENEAILGFTSNATQNIKVWTTGANVIPPPVPAAPVFSIQPTGQTVLQGQTLTLTSAASDTTSYQWYKDGIALIGENLDTLVVTNFNASKAGTYKVQAIGLGGNTDSSNAVVINDVGVLVNNFTAQDLDGGTHIGISITATDGVDTISIASGTNGRLRSGVSITISGYTTTPLTSQDGLGNNVDLDPTTQTYSPPINSPLSVYHRAVGSGTCYSIELDDSDINSDGADLYVTIRRPGTATQSYPYYTFDALLEPDPNKYAFILCSEIIPTYKYGVSGASVTVPSLVETTGGFCSNDGECSF